MKSKMSRRKVLSISIASALLPLFGHAEAEFKYGNSVESADRRMKIVVIGAHPDDPETGCGGTICLLSKAGHEVVSAYLTRGERGIPGKSLQEAAEIRTQEAKKACEIMNARPEFMGQIDGDTEVNENRCEEIKLFLQSEKPDMVFTHWPIDTHRDHRVCSLLVYDAWLQLEKSFALYYFEVMTGEQSQNFLPSVFVNIESVIAEKHAASFVHESQLIESMYIDSHARMEVFRGMECGCKYAEAFIEQVQGPDRLLP